jgi:hypothetical protein
MVSAERALGMTSDMQKVLEFAHRANIDRYRRLLKTYLTVNERQFIERRLGDEEKALIEIAHRTALVDCPNAA